MTLEQEDIDYLVCRLREINALLDMGEIYLAKAKLLADISALTTEDVKFSDYLEKAKETY